MGVVLSVCVDGCVVLSVCVGSVECCVGVLTGCVCGVWMGVCECGVDVCVYVAGFRKLFLFEVRIVLGAHLISSFF